MIELLIAVTILAVMVSIVYATFSTVVNATESSRLEAKWMRRQQFLARSFEANFPAAYIDQSGQQPAYQFVGTSVDGPDGPKDVVEFCTSSSLIGGASLPGDLKRVHYELLDTGASPFELGYDDMPDSEKRGSMIQATETPLLGSNLASQMTDPSRSPDSGFSLNDTKNNTSSLNQTDSVVSPQWTLPEIRSMDITYFDGVQYVEEWDSSTMGRLPQYVDIKINYWKPQDVLDQEKHDGLDPKEDPDFEMVIPVTLGLGVTEPAPVLTPNPNPNPNPNPDERR